MEILKLLIQFLMVPLFAWVWWTDRRLIKIESSQITKEDLTNLVDSITKLSEKIEDKFVSVESCNFRHQIKKS